jgi:hypothetical protein
MVRIQETERWEESGGTSLRFCSSLTKDPSSYHKVVTKPFCLFISSFYATSKPSSDLPVWCSHLFSLWISFMRAGLKCTNKKRELTNHLSIAHRGIFLRSERKPRECTLQGGEPVNQPQRVLHWKLQHTSCFLKLRHNPHMDYTPTYSFENFVTHA